MEESRDRGVPQSLVLAAVMFMIYINDKPKGIKSYMSLFAEGGKLLRKARIEEDCEELEKSWMVFGCNWLWEMELNANTCHVMKMRKSKIKKI